MLKLNCLARFSSGGVILRVLLLGVLALFINGCGTTDAGTNQPTPPTVINLDDVLKVGELVKIEFSGTPTQVPPHAENIKQDGTITLDYIGSIKAAGKTTGQLQIEIYTNYVPKYYKNMNVTVRGDERFYSVGGEVKIAQRLIYYGPTTVLGAVNAAGGFTDFADKRNVRLIRGQSGKVEIINCVKALKTPSVDKQVYPGDTVYVDKRLF